MILQNIYSALNFLGVTSLLGGEVSKNSLKYINIDAKNNKKLRKFTSFLVMPGLYSISGKILKRNNNKIARIFSPGNRENKRDILGFKGTNKYKYIGMVSGTKTSVSNILFESWLNKRNQNKKGEKTILFNKNILFNMKRETKNVNVGLLKETNCKLDYKIINSNDKLLTKRNIISILFQFIAILPLFLLFILRDYFSMFIIIFNMLSYFLIIFILNDEEYKIPNINPYNEISGNSLITNQSGNDLWIILGDEIEIQNLLQHEVVENKNKMEKIEVCVSIICCIVSIISILFMSSISEIGKIFYGIELCIGLLTGIIYSSVDGDKLLKELCEDFYRINEKDVEIKSFSNRSSSIAYIILKTKGYTKLLGNLIPEVNEWEYFRNILDNINLLDNNEINELLKHIKNDNYDNINNIENLKNELIKEIPIINNMIKTNLGKRLFDDILEGYIEV